MSPAIPPTGESTWKANWPGVHYIGYGMKQWDIHVHGNAGRHVGGEMSGGRIEVDGNAGDWLGGEMHGGLIQSLAMQGIVSARPIPAARRG